MQPSQEHPTPCALAAAAGSCKGLARWRGDQVAVGGVCGQGVNRWRRGLRPPKGQGGLGDEVRAKVWRPRGAIVPRPLAHARAPRLPTSLACHEKGAAWIERPPARRLPGARSAPSSLHPSLNPARRCVIAASLTCGEAKLDRQVPLTDWGAAGLLKR